MFYPFSFYGEDLDRIEKIDIFVNTLFFPFRLNCEGFLREVDLSSLLYTVHSMELSGWKYNKKHVLWLGSLFQYK